MTQLRIVVPSHVSYSDAWKPFTALFKRFWPDCQYLCTIVSSGGVADVDFDDWVVKQYPAEWPWCRRLLVEANEGDSDDLLLIMQEDFFLNADVNIAMIEYLATRLLNRDYLRAMRIVPIPGPDGPDLFKEVGTITSGAAYRVSCQATIWKSDSLIQLLRGIINRSSGTAADFEITGTSLSIIDSYEFACWKRDSHPWPMQYICSAITQGKWNPDALELCKKYGIEVDTSRREVDRK